jgi:uncharacterized protein
MSAIVIDTFEFARQKDHREGQIVVAEMARLATVSTDASAMLQWSLTGGAGKLGHPQLTLSVSATVQPVCQRCLTPFSLEIKSESVLVLAKDEAEADKIEAMLDDDAFEVIVGGKEMNILDLIEDEALLALPLSPRHEVCPDTAALEAQKGSKPSPFAVLKGINR